MNVTRLGAIVVICLVSAPWATLEESFAAEAFHASRLSELKLLKGTLPAPGSSSASDWRLRSALRPRVVLRGDGEACLDIEADRWLWNTDFAGNLLCIRLPEPREVSGRLYFPTGDAAGMQVVEFVIPAAEARDAARAAFFRAKETSYRQLLDLQLPGAAWFRHQNAEALRALGNAPADPTQPALQRRPPGPGELEDTFDIFTGGKAISENLQLDRLLAPVGQDTEPVDVDSLPGITATELDWAPLVKDLKPTLDALAAHIPADQHAVFFPTFADMTAVLDEADARGTPVLQLLEPRSEDARSKERAETQLCLAVSALSRLLGPRVIASVAMTGSDPYIRTGSDVAILFEAKEPTVLKTYIAAKHEAALKEAPGAKALKGDVAGVEWTGVATPDRSISSYMATLDRAIVVTNSLLQLRLIVDATRGTAPSLAGLPEYAFFRDRYKVGEDGESAFLLLSDAAIRRWCGARWRIGSSRRTRAAAVLSELQAAYLDPLARGKVEAGPLHTTLQVPGGGEFRLGDRGVSSSTYGTLEFLTPIRELDLDKVTKAEADAYRRWRDGYQQNWRQYFDPIAVRLVVRGDRLAADVSVLPLIAATEYAEAIRITEGAKIGPRAGDPHPEALLHFVMALSAESEPVRQAGGFIVQMVPAFKANPLGWLGSTLSVYADEDPFWDELARAEKPEAFLEDHYSRLPLALRVDVKNPLTAAAFLASMRAFIEQTAPGLTRWETLQHGEQAYVKVAPTAQAGVPQELKDLAVYYATTPDSVTLTLSESLLKRALDRAARAAKAAAEAPSGDAGPVPERPWLGESYCLQADARMAKALERTSRDAYLVQLRMASWANLPILNEWKRLYPSEDPVRLHERLWGVKLHCPGGGRYVWNADLDTMESTAFGCPGHFLPAAGATPADPARPASPAPPSWPLADFRSGNFGVTFEKVGASQQGLRARAVLERKPKP